MAFGYASSYFNRWNALFDNFFLLWRFVCWKLYQWKQDCMMHSSWKIYGFPLIFRNYIVKFWGEYFDSAYRFWWLYLFFIHWSSSVLWFMLWKCNILSAHNPTRGKPCVLSFNGYFDSCYRSIMKYSEFLSSSCCNRT